MSKTFKCKTTAREGEVVSRTLGGDTGCVKPPVTEYWRVVDECGQNGYYGPKDVVQTNHDDFQKHGVDK